MWVSLSDAQAIRHLERHFPCSQIYALPILSLTFLGFRLLNAMLFFSFLCLFFSTRLPFFDDFDEEECAGLTLPAPESISMSELVSHGFCTESVQCFELTKDGQSMLKQHLQAATRCESCYVGTETKHSVEVVLAIIRHRHLFILAPFL